MKIIIRKAVLDDLAQIKILLRKLHDNHLKNTDNIFKDHNDPIRLNGLNNTIKEWIMKII